MIRTLWFMSYILTPIQNVYHKYPKESKAYGDDHSSSTHEAKSSCISRGSPLRDSLQDHLHSDETFAMLISDVNMNCVCSIMHTNSKLYRSGHSYLQFQVVYKHQTYSA